MSKLAAAVPTRDSPTWASYLLITSYSWFIFGLSATQALIRDEQGTSRTVSSLHAVLFSLGGIVAGLIAARLILALGRGKFLKVAVGGATFGVLIYTVGLLSHRRICRLIIWLCNYCGSKCFSLRPSKTSRPRSCH